MTCVSHQVLIKRGVTLDDCDNLGDQAIHYAARAGSKQIIDMLIQGGITKCVKGERRSRISMNKNGGIVFY